MTQEHTHKADNMSWLSTFSSSALTNHKLSCYHLNSISLPLNECVISKDLLHKCLHPANL